MTDERRRNDRRVADAFTALAAFVAVIALDVIYRRNLPLPLPLTATVDWSAHLGTTLLFLLALRSRASRTMLIAALVSTVLIDLDHIPHVAWSAWSGHEAPGAQLWFVHNLFAMAIAIVIGGVSSGRRRELWLGVAIGVGTHIFRNAAVGEGPPLAWPISTRHASIPYELHLLVLAGLLAACLRPASGFGGLTSSRF